MLNELAKLFKDGRIEEELKKLKSKSNIAETRSEINELIESIFPLKDNKRSEEPKSNCCKNEQCKRFKEELNVTSPSIDFGNYFNQLSGVEKLSFFKNNSLDLMSKDGAFIYSSKFINKQTKSTFTELKYIPSKNHFDGFGLELLVCKADFKPLSIYELNDYIPKSEKLKSFKHMGELEDWLKSFGKTRVIDSDGEKIEVFEFDDGKNFSISIKRKTLK